MKTILINIIQRSPFVLLGDKMLTKGQYEFLKKFIQACEESIENDKTCKETGKKMIDAKTMHHLLSSDSSLLPNDPYLSKVEDANFEPGTESDISTMNSYLTESGLDDYIKYDNYGYYKTTFLVNDAISQYEKNLENRKRTKTTYIIGLLTFVLAFLTFIITIIFKFI